MSVTLSSSDVRLLGRAATTILTPEAELPFDAWRLAVNDVLRELVQGDFAVFGVSTSAGKSCVCADRPLEITRLVEGVFASAEDTGNTRGTAFGLEVLTLERVVRGDWLEYQRDWAVNEIFQPNGMSDIVSISLHWGGGASQVSGACMATVYRDELATERFGEMGATLFELLLPAFRSAIGTRIRASSSIHSRAEDMCSLLDMTGAAVMLLGARGDVIHESSGLYGLLAADSDSFSLRAAMRRTGMSLVARLHLERSDKIETARRSAAADASADFRTRGATYHVRATYANDHAGERIVMVSLERQSHIPFAKHEIRSRYGLTARQLEVAELLAMGRSNAEIAHRLGVSDATARRHTEQVLRKLGVQRRAAVGPRLRSEF